MKNCGAARENGDDNDEAMEIENFCYNELKKSIFPTKISISFTKNFFSKVSVQFAC